MLFSTDKKYDPQWLQRHLFEQLKREHAFWSYDQESVSLDRISDDQLFALTLRYLDLDDINAMFATLPYKAIKKSWLKNLVPEGEYLINLNYLLALKYFKAKRPAKYLKSMETRYFNSLCK